MKREVILQHLQHFDMGQIADSGQVFRMEKVADSTYILIAKGRLLKITQRSGSSSLILHDCTIGEYEELWKDYFDMQTDYHQIIVCLGEKDRQLQQAITFGDGVRILRQDPWEMLISFIISQNKAIPHIKQCIGHITKRFGEPIVTEETFDTTYYSFPTPAQLGNATEEALRECKVGFRAPYIVDACQKVLSGEVALNDLHGLPAEEIKTNLMKIKGVGPKIADCITLFAYSKGEVFPTDVWIKRVVEGIYFEGQEKSLKEIQQFAKDYYGELAGYAQQYLFFYGRENALFK